MALLSIGTPPQVSPLPIQLKISIRDGLGKYSKIKISKFVATDTKPSNPPPLRVKFCGKKFNPHFFLETESMIAKTNFTLGPIEKSIFLVQL